MTTAGRKLAEDGIARTREVYERYAEAGEIALNAFETTTGRMVSNLRGLTGTGQARDPVGGAPANGFETVAARSWAGMREIAQRVLVASDTNIRAGFDHAESLVRARDAREILELQAAYLRAQAERFAAQMLDLQKTTTRVAQDLGDGFGRDLGKDLGKDLGGDPARDPGRDRNRDAKGGAWGTERP